jgi:hypothetical protein
MKRNQRTFLSLLTAMALAAASMGWAGVRKVNVQGKLTDSGGAPLSGAQTVTFKLYDVATAGTMVWTSGVLSVTPASGGLFNVALQDGTPSLDSVSFDKPYYLGITVGADSEMTPRQEMGSTALSHGSPKDFTVNNNLIVANGQVGIGTISPTQKLRVDGNDKLSLYATQTGYHDYGTVLALQTSGDGAQNGPRISFMKSNSKSWSMGVQTGLSKSFSVWENGSNDGWGAERFTIAPGGNIGINTTTPGEALEVRGNVKLSNASMNIRALTPTYWGYSAGYPVVLLGPTSGTGNVAIGYDPSGNSYGGFTGDGREVLFRNGAQFVTPNSANNSFYLYQMVLKDGKVGIGTPTPGEALEVHGNVKLSNASISIRAMTPTNWGYSTDYPVVLLGPTSGVGNVSIGYDPSGNSYGGFTGDGREVLFRNGAQFVTPNSANNSFYLYQMVLKDGKVGIGTPTPQYALDVAGTIRGNNLSPSDLVLKKNVRPLPGDTLRKMSQLNGVSFEWDRKKVKEALRPASAGKSAGTAAATTSDMETQGFPDTPQIGLIAQDVEKAFPSLVETDANGVKSVYYMGVTAVLVEAVKAQQKQIEDQTSRIEDLTSRIKALEKK